MRPGGADEESWRRGLAALVRRADAIPGFLSRALRELPRAVTQSIGEARFAPGRLRSVVATGAGSSAAHARYLTSLLAELGVAARFAPLTSFAADAIGDAPRDVLVVFSQGVSPNARLALAHAARFAATWLVTATPAASGCASGEAPHEVPTDIAERRAALAGVRERGVRVIEVPGGEEYGTLLRLVGPMTGYVAALALADELARAANGAAAPTRPWHAPPVDEVCARVGAAHGWIDRPSAELDAAACDSPIVLLTSDSHLDRIENLRLKIQEGLLRPPPAVCDLLDFAHGPFQQIHDASATLLALGRGDAPNEGELLARLEGMLDPGRHRLLRLSSALPGPYAIFEHEALVNALVLRAIADRRIDQASWPGKGGDAPLYEVGRDLPAVAIAEAQRDASGGCLTDASRARALEQLTWPELEARLAAGCRLAVLPLGSTEQHGPHLPFATDTWIARELARRLCARLPEAIELPAIALGCASEHLGFPGTLSLREETLQAILCDVAASLARHGFERLFVFSAHGGNRAALDGAVAAMRSAAPTLQIDLAPSPAELAAVFRRASREHGVAASASGAHAGEFESSIVARLAPGALRFDRLAAGRLVERGAGDLFYPDLRRNAPDGTVGDPRACDPARADAYLEAWVDCLVESARRGASRT